MDRPSGPQPSCLIVVNFHHVRAEPDPEFPHLHGLTLPQFRRQLDALEREFELIAPADLERALLAEAPLPARACLLTFDDGLRDHYEVVLPELRRRGLRAAFFVCTQPLVERILLSVHRAHLLSGKFGYLELWDELLQAAGSLGIAGPEDACQHRAPLQYRYDDPETARVKYYLNFQLDPEQRCAVLRKVFRSRFGEEAWFVDRHYASAAHLRELQAAGMAVGLHSHRHLPLAAVPDRVMRADLAENAARLHDLLGIRPRWISYPYGGPDAWSTSVQRAAREMGLVGGFTMTRQVNRLPLTPLAIGRLDTNDAPGGKQPMRWERLVCESA